MLQTLNSHMQSSHTFFDNFQNVDSDRSRTGVNISNIIDNWRRRNFDTPPLPRQNRKHRHHPTWMGSGQWNSPLKLGDTIIQTIVAHAEHDSPIMRRFLTSQH